MGMSKPGVHSDLIVDLAKRMVDAAAPAERYIFQALCQDFLTARRYPWRRRGRRTHPLGVGLAEVAVLVTPAALTAASAVVTYVVDSVAGAAADRAVAATAEHVRRLFGRAPDGDPQPSRLTLSGGQWHEIESIVRKAAAEAGIGDEQAKAMADALRTDVLERDGTD